MKQEDDNSLSYYIAFVSLIEVYIFHLVSFLFWGVMQDDLF